MATVGGWLARRKVVEQILACGALAVTIGPARALNANPRTTTRGKWDPRSNWIPMEIATGDVLIVAADVAGVPVRAMLDSGSGASVIGQSLAARLGAGHREQRTISGLSGKAPVRLVRDVDVALGQDVRRLPFLVEANLQTLSSAFGRTIDLVLGADMMTGKSLTLDFAGRRFASAETGTFAGGDDWTRLALARGRKEELYILGSINGQTPAPLMFDLGSGAALMLSSKYVKAHRLTRGKPTSTAARGGVEGVEIVRIFMTDRVGLGSSIVRHAPTVVTDNWLSIDTVGNIGLPLIAQFDVVLDITANSVWLRNPAVERRLPMLKDRSGLGLAESGGVLVVVHVSAGSPAEKAGWLAGDRIVSVNGRSIDTAYTFGSMWRWRFGPSGTVVKLGLDRAGVRELRLADYY